MTKKIKKTLKMGQKIKKMSPIIKKSCSIVYIYPRDSVLVRRVFAYFTATNISYGKRRSSIRKFLKEMVLRKEKNEEKLVEQAFANTFPKTQKSRAIGIFKKNILLKVDETNLAGGSKKKTSSSSKKSVAESTKNDPTVVKIPFALMAMPEELDPANHARDEGKKVKKKSKKAKKEKKKGSLAVQISRITDVAEAAQNSMGLSTLL